MKEIICSAGKGRMPKDACLDCALTSITPPCGYDYSLLNAMYKSPKRTGIHVSDLVGCLKSSYLKQTQPLPEYPHEMLTRTLGTAVHSILEKSDEHAMAEIDIEADGIMGRADRIYHNGRVLEIKTTRWIYPDKLPYGSHALQVNLYGYLLKRMGYEVNSLAIQYVDMSGPTKCRKCRLLVRQGVFGLACPKCGGEPKNAHLGALLVEIPIMDEDELSKMIETRRDDLQAALETGIMPLGEPSFLCGYCAFLSICEEGQTYWKGE